MPLDLRTRNIELPGGVTVKCKPLDTWAQQGWLEFTMRTVGAGSSLASTDAGRQEAGVKVFLSGEGRELIEKILRAHVKEVVGLQVLMDEGPRNGTIEDILSNGGAYSQYALPMLMGLMNANRLTETDVKNSNALPAAF